MNKENIIKLISIILDENTRRTVIVGLDDTNVTYMTKDYKEHTMDFKMSQEEALKVYCLLSRLVDDSHGKDDFGNDFFAGHLKDYPLYVGGKKSGSDSVWLLTVARNN